MRKIYTFSILPTIYCSVLIYSRRNAAQKFPSFTLSTQVEVGSFVCKEVYENLTIPRNDFTNRNSHYLLQMAGELLIPDYPALLTIGGRTSNQLVADYLLPATKTSSRYEYYRPNNEEHL